jgi:hypothetical protein
MKCVKNRPWCLGPDSTISTKICLDCQRAKTGKSPVLAVTQTASIGTAKPTVQTVSKPAVTSVVQPSSLVQQTPVKPVTPSIGTTAPLLQPPVLSQIPTQSSLKPVTRLVVQPAISPASNISLAPVSGPSPSTPSNFSMLVTQFHQGMERLGTWKSYMTTMNERIQSNLGEYKDMSVPTEWTSLSEEEQLAIWMYTKQYFRFWNPLLYKNDTKGMAKYEAALAVFKSGLAKLPVYPAEAYRGDGEHKTRHESHTQGATFTVKAFWSTTHDEGLFSKTGQFGAGVRYNIAKGHAGRLIEFVSESPQEREVLFLPNSSFQVTQRTGDPAKKQSVIINVVQTA